jgi:hypothetical protein
MPDTIDTKVAKSSTAGGETYPRHVRIALRSEAELQTQLELAMRLKLLTARRA